MVRQSYIYSSRFSCLLLTQHIFTNLLKAAVNYLKSIIMQFKSSFTLSMITGVFLTTALGSVISNRDFDFGVVDFGKSVWFFPRRITVLNRTVEPNDGEHRLSGTYSIPKNDLAENHLGQTVVGALLVTSASHRPMVLSIASTSVAM